jgi:hypothetical protein
VGEVAEGTKEGLGSPPEATTIEVRNSMVGILPAQEFPLLFTGDPESARCPEVGSEEVRGQTRSACFRARLIPERSPFFTILR